MFVFSVSLECSVWCYSIFVRISGVRGHVLGHVHASDAVAVDAVVEGRVIERRITLQLLHHIPRLLSRLPLPCRKTEE